MEHNIVDKISGGGGGGTFTSPDQTEPEGHPPTLQWISGLFPGVKRPECGFEHAPNLVSRLSKEQSYDSNNLWAFMARSTVNFTLYIFDKAQ